MKLTKEECLELGKQYILKYNCYPAAKGWSISSAGCSRDRIYENWNSWSTFIFELKNIVDIPEQTCLTSNTVIYKNSKKCKNCSKLTLDRNTYCSNNCHNEYKNKKVIEDFLAGKYVGKNVHTSKNSWLRNYLVELYGEICSSCGIGPIYNDKPLTLEVDHIDGKCYNNCLENLRFLCPNCHSQTDTYKAKNKISDNKNRYKI
jgi:hypothetical protein